MRTFMILFSGVLTLCLLGSAIYQHITLGATNEVLYLMCGAIFTQNLFMLWGGRK